MAMINKNNNISPQKDTVIFDYLSRIEKSSENYQALYLFSGKLQNKGMRSAQRQSLN